MTEETIRQIEQAQRKLRDAQSRARLIIKRQNERLELNRRLIDQASGLAYDEGVRPNPAKQS